MSHIRNFLERGNEYFRERDNALIATCLALSALIFLFDINVPLGVAGGVPYMAVILLAAPLSKSRNSLYLALLCSVLVLIGFFASPPGGELWKVFANRAFALFAIWVTAGLSLMHRKGVDEIASSERRKAGMLESALDGIISVDDSGTVIEYNPAAERIFGFTSKEAMGARAGDLFVPSEHRATYEAKFQKYRGEDTNGKAGLRFETVARRSNQETFPIEIGIARFRAEGESIFTAHIRDIGDIKRKESERIRLEKAIEHTTEAVVITDREGVIQYVNPSFEQITGYTAAEAIGKRPSILKSGEHDRSVYDELWKTIASGEVWTGSLTNRRKDGSLYVEAMSIAPIRDEQGNVTNFVAVKRDRTFEIGLEKQLRQSQKMEAIGTLAGGIAHDFNNILFAIRGFTELSRDLSDGDEQLAGYLEEIGKAELRASDLVKQILTFSRQGEQVKRPLRVQSILKEAIKLLSGTLPTTIEIQMEISKLCGFINADPTQIHQVIMNLCTNAYQAMGDTGGILTICLEEQRIDTGRVDNPPDLNSGDYVKLTISDTGCGMDEETLCRIFEPFFTTKELAQGTGLGLATAHGIVEDHGGAIVAASTVGQGTTMEVFLPQCQEKIESPSPRHDGGAPPRGHEKLLIVDDEEQIVKLTKSALRRLGYKITATSSPEEALKIFNAAPESFDLVITDLIMPKIDGVKLSKELRRIRPGIPVIICTGFSESLDRFGGHDADISGLIQKPAGTQEIARAIRAALENPSEKDINEPSPCN